MLMTSRERVRTVLAGGVPDRLPSGLGAAMNAGMHVHAYEKLKSLLGLATLPTRLLSFEANAVFDLEVLRAIDADMVSLGGKFSPSQLYLPGSDGQWALAEIWGRPILVPASWSVSRDEEGSTWIDGLRWDATESNLPAEALGCRLLCPPGGSYFDVVPLSSDAPPERFDPADYRPARDLPEELLRRLEDSARWLFQNTPYALVCDETITDLQVAPGGAERWWLRLLEEPAAVHEYLERAREASISQLVGLEQAIGNYTDMLMIAHDFGDLRGVQIGPALWREIYKPHYARWFAEWKAVSGMKICLHSCGSIVDIIPDLVEIGLDVLNPVQVSARGMDPAELKRRFGRRLVFYGGSWDAVGMQGIEGDDEVYERVKRNILDLGAGGGYIFAGVHNIQDLPESRLSAVLRAFRDAREEAVR
jgi:uroporphyrinogen decarboxylase